jgi:MFS family permease
MEPADPFAGMDPMPFDRRLDLVNFLLADVRGGLGPYVGIFLLGQAHWDQATIGLVLTVSGLVGISLHAPIGALIDTTRSKRALLVGGVAALAASAIAIVTAPALPVVLGADIIMAVLGAVFAPTVAAITVGVATARDLARRLARNAACDRAGNIAAAAAAGLAGWALSLEAVFYLVPVFGLLAAAAVLSIPAGAIDHDRARGLVAAAPTGHPHAESWQAMLRHRPLLVLALGMALFHFANAPILLLVGLELEQQRPATVTLVMSTAIIIAQLVSIPVALLVGARADRWGRKPLWLLGFAALPLRALLFALTEHPAWIVAGQLLDGISLGTQDALLALILADIMRGTGRYNAARGLVGTVQGIGGSASNAVAGLLVVRAGYATAFATLAGVAAAAFLLVVAALPETRPAPGRQEAARLPAAS